MEQILMEILTTCACGRASITGLDYKKLLHDRERIEDMLAAMKKGKEYAHNSMKKHFLEFEDAAGYLDPDRSIVGEDGYLRP